MVTVESRERARALRWVRRCSVSSRRAASSVVTRRTRRRRSTSSWVSPGPRVPMRPACWLRVMPRLRGRGTTLSQQAGRIGTRGPGETQLEVDRRRLVRRVTTLEAALRELTEHRRTQRKARARSRLSTVTIVGYTNAGKSTLLNHLTDAGVLVEDRLFATVDPTTRRLELPGGERVLLTDTVGFVRKLPHQLVQAFRSTLDEVAEADLLIHVVDVSAPDPDAHIRAVSSVLAETGASD